LHNEQTTWRDDQQIFASDSPRITRVRSEAKATGRDKLTYPFPQTRSFFLPGDGSKTTPREDFCEDLLDALALGLGDYFEKTAAFKTIGVALSGGRGTPLCLHLRR